MGGHYFFCEMKNDPLLWKITVGFLLLINNNYSIVTIWLKWNLCIMLFFTNSFRYAAVKKGRSCLCLARVEERNRLNSSFCDVRYILNYALFKVDTLSNL